MEQPTFKKHLWLESEQNKQTNKQINHNQKKPKTPYQKKKKKENKKEENI